MHPLCGFLGPDDTCNRNVVARASELFRCDGVSCVGVEPSGGVDPDRGDPKAWRPLVPRPSVGRIPGMSDYADLVKKEAKAFYEENKKDFLADAGEFGGKAAQPSLMRWLDRTEKLALRAQKIAEPWGAREHRWVQTHTRTKASQGGDPGSKAFASFLQDLRFAIKKLAKT